MTSVPVSVCSVVSCAGILFSCKFYFDGWHRWDIWSRTVSCVCFVIPLSCWVEYSTASTLRCFEVEHTEPFSYIPGRKCQAWVWNCTTKSPFSIFLSAKCELRLAVFNSACAIKWLSAFCHFCLSRIVDSTETMHAVVVLILKVDTLGISTCSFHLPRILNLCSPSKRSMVKTEWHQVLTHSNWPRPLRGCLAVAPGTLWWCCTPSPSCAGEVPRKTWLVLLPDNPSHCWSGTWPGGAGTPTLDASLVPPGNWSTGAARTPPPPPSRLGPSQDLRWYCWTPPPWFQNLAKSKFPAGQVGVLGPRAFWA